MTVPLTGQKPLAGEGLVVSHPAPASGPRLGFQAHLELTSQARNPTYSNSMGSRASRALCS